MSLYTVNDILEILKFISIDSDKRTHIGPGKKIESNICYQSINLDSIKYDGNRDCDKRIHILESEVDFSNKNVLDIGCNIGGMLYPLSNKIRQGVGIDYNHRVINGANIIKSYKNNENLSFFIFDLDNEPLDLLHNYIKNIDIIFLFAMCLWVKKWKLVIDFISENSKILFIETNGSEGFQTEQIQYCKKKFNNFKLLLNASSDDKFQSKRKLYLCTNN